jgi:hypothetical protein
MRSVLITSLIALLCCTAQAEILRNKHGVAQSGFLQTSSRLFLEQPTQAPWDEAEATEDVEATEGFLEQPAAPWDEAEATEDVEATEGFLEQPAAPWDEAEATEDVEATEGFLEQPAAPWDEAEATEDVEATGDASE